VIEEAQQFAPLSGYWTAEQVITVSCEWASFDPDRLQIRQLRDTWTFHYSEPSTQLGRLADCDKAPPPL